MPTLRRATTHSIIAVAAALTATLPVPVLAQETAGGQRFDWPSHNLDLYGSRYAAIDQIDTTNAGRLELAWSVEMERDHVITQVTPVVVDGVLYFSDAAGAAFALDPASGEPLWTSDFGPDSISKRVIRPGGLVIAADARTAEIRWVFNTIPQRPGDEGYDVARPTWGDGLRAGGGVWTVPAVDPELGLVYVNAGNPSADYDGSEHPEAVVTARVDDHVRARRHVAAHALRAARSRFVEVMRRRVVALGPQHRETFLRRLAVALRADGVAFGGKAEAVRVVTVRAAHPGAVHPALRERPPHVHFSADLPVRVVQTVAQRARLERLGAERVRQLEVGMLPVRTLRIDKEAVVAREEPGRHAEVGERRIAEVAEDRLRRGRLHGQVVVGTRPGLMLRLVALGAGRFIDIGAPGSAGAALLAGRLAGIAGAGLAACGRGEGSRRKQRQSYREPRRCHGHTSSRTGATDS